MPISYYPIGLTVRKGEGKIFQLQKLMKNLIQPYKLTSIRVGAINVPHDIGFNQDATSLLRVRHPALLATRHRIPARALVELHGAVGRKPLDVALEGIVVRIDEVVLVHGDGEDLDQVVQRVLRSRGRLRRRRRGVGFLHLIYRNRL